MWFTNFYSVLDLQDINKLESKWNNSSNMDSTLTLQKIIMFDKKEKKTSNRLPKLKTHVLPLVSLRSSSDSTRLYLDIFQMCIGHFLLCSLHKPMIGTSKNDANFITAVHTALNSFQNIICTLNYLLIIIMDQLVKLILPKYGCFWYFNLKTK